MKDTPQDPQSFDDAFDARCRDVLSQRSVPAPPFAPPVVPAMGAGKKVILAVGAVALMATGGFMWTAGEPVAVPVEVPVNPDPMESAIEVQVDMPPAEANIPDAGERAIDAGTSMVETQADETEPATETVEVIVSTPVVEEAQTAVASDVVGPGRQEAIPQVVAAEDPKNTGAKVDVETPAEEATPPEEEELEQKHEGEAPVLRLPITLPPGGGR